MKNKIKKILLETLTSNYDNGNIDDCGIMGGDNAVDQLYDLFVDEIAEISTATASSRSKTDDYKEHMQSTNSAKINQKNEFSPLYFNSKTGETQKLFDVLIPNYTVCIQDENVLDGLKGCKVSITIEALNAEEAMDKVMKNKEFTKHIKMKDFDRKYLNVFNPTGNYVIGKVEYYKGDDSN